MLKIICITVFSVDLRAPTNVVAVRSCDAVTLQWDEPSEPNDNTTSVSCTPPSPGCTECTTSPCTVTGLNASIEYVFTVTLNSGGCKASMNTTLARINGEIQCVFIPGATRLQWNTHITNQNPDQTVCYKQGFVISEQFPMRYCSTWLRSLLCYIKKFVIRVFHCIFSLAASPYFYPLRGQ